MKSKARNLVERWVDLPFKDKKPTYLGEYRVFMLPSSSNESTHQLVAWKQMKRGSDQFLCSCKGWYFAEADFCRHVAFIMQQITDGREKIAQAQAVK